MKLGKIYVQVIRKHLHTKHPIHANWWNEMPVISTLSLHVKTRLRPSEENLPRNKTFKQRAEGDKNDQDPRRHGGQARRAGMERNDPAVQAERWETAPEMKQLGVSPDPRHLGSAPIPYSPTIHNVQISFQNFSDSHHLNGQYWWLYFDYYFKNKQYIVTVINFQSF